MSEIGTGYIIEVGIETCKSDIDLANLDFTLEFFVYANRKVTYAKSDLVRVQTQAGDRYYALLDSALVGSGMLRCRARISDKVRRWENGVRPVILTAYTGKVIGCMTQNDDYYCSCGDASQDFDEGYRLSFNFVYGLPKADVAYIIYGSISDEVHGFGEITQEMLVNPNNNIISVAAESLGKTPISGLEAGDKLLVLVPADSSKIARKDDGIGGKMAFDTTIMGSNGDVSLDVDGVPYKVYGEFMTTNGEMFIYVD